mmetsp:Transcript_75427/g.232801  ORF Transcript_75427/g.232801 Transcript_75427/m.232801 type:complete len:281 (-) Transcript_75427:72-914(-)
MHPPQPPASPGTAIGRAPAVRWTNRRCLHLRRAHASGVTTAPLPPSWPPSWPTWLRHHKASPRQQRVASAPAGSLAGCRCATASAPRGDCRRCRTAAPALGPAPAQGPESHTMRPSAWPPARAACVRAASPELSLVLRLLASPRPSLEATPCSWNSPCWPAARGGGAAAAAAAVADVEATSEKASPPAAPMAEPAVRSGASVRGGRPRWGLDLQTPPGPSATQVADDSAEPAHSVQARHRSVPHPCHAATESHPASCLGVVTPTSQLCHAWCVLGRSRRV